MNEPQTNEIHLWPIFDESIKSKFLIEKFYKLLSVEEIALHRKLRLARHSHQYLVTRAAIRIILSMYFPSVSPSHWSFSKNKYGKPEIVPFQDVPRLQFNISHTNSVIAIVVCQRGDIGVDVECVKNGSERTNIAKRYFSKLEIEQLLFLPSDKQNERFIELWTLKEAYIKACGIGLTIPLNQFMFDLDSDGIEILFTDERNDDAALWQFWLAGLGINHKLSIAIKTRKRDCSHKIVTCSFCLNGMVPDDSLSILRCSG